MVACGGSVVKLDRRHAAQEIPVPAPGVKRRQWRKQRQGRRETALGASFANRRYGQAEADRNALPRAGANSTRRDATTGDLTGPTNGFDFSTLHLLQVPP